MIQERGERVLQKAFVVDDEPWIVEYFRKVVAWNQYGWELVGAETDSVEAYRKLKSHPVDLLITDICMPEYDGLWLIEQLRGQVRHVVIISGHEDFSYALRGLRLGVDDFLLKPISTETVHTLLERLAAEVVRHDKAEPLDTEVKKDVIAQVVDYVNNNFRRDISLQKAAQAHYVSASYLSTAFKKRTGVAFSQYVIDLRLKRAREYLQKNEYTVETVMKDCGFRDYSNFCKAFKSKFGISPGKLRSMSRRIQDEREKSGM